jgi:hypothetical protein
MTSKRYRIQSIGGNPANGKQAQFYIALPTPWVRSNGLGKGDELEIYMDEMKRLIVKIPSG